MTIEEAIIKYPQLNKITEQLVNKIALDKFGKNLDYNKNLRDNGFDDLDCIEMIMEIEKSLDIVISDEIVEVLFDLDKNPPRFQQYWRNKKLEDLGI